MSHVIKTTGVELHGVRLNLSCNYDRLFEYVTSLIGDDTRATWDEPDLEVSAVWRTEPLPEGASAFDGEGADGVGKRMLRRDDELIWFDTHRDKDLQLRFRGNGHCRGFDVDYCYQPSTKKLARYPDYEQRKFFALLRYLVHFPIAWHLQRSRGWSLIHASAVADGDRGILIAGPGGAGKTTTCMALMARGLSLVTENLLFSDGEHVYALPEPIRLTDDSLSLLAQGPIQLRSFNAMGGLKHKSLFRLPEATLGTPIRPAAVFIPQFAQPGFVRPVAPPIAAELIGAANRLTLELNDFDWYTAALDLLWPAAGNAERQQQVLQRLTASTPTYVLGIDRSAGVEPVVDRILECLNGTPSVSVPVRREPRASAVDIQTSPDGVPIRCFTGEELLPDAPALAQLDHVAGLPGVVRHVSVLPDVHFKSRNPTPTGTVVVSQNVIVPRAIDPGINCGMRIVATSIPVDALTVPVIDELYGQLRSALPIEAHEQALLSNQDCEALLAHGLSAVRSALELTDQDVDRVENRGRMLPEFDAAALRAVVTPKAVRKGNPWLGTLGAGNHFLELQEIVDILSPREAAALGLERGHAVFMMHTDSRRLGKQIMKPLREEAAHALNLSPEDSATGPDGLWTLPVDSDLGRRFLCGLAAASHAAYANRAAITTILRRIVRSVLRDPSLALPLVFDCGHETIQRERHGDDWLWVHRHGASSARPAGVLTHDPVLAAIGQPVPIPGSMGSDSFIGVARPGARETFHSVAHGAGRVLEKVRAAEVFDEGEIEDSVRRQGVRLYRYGTDNIAGQAPASFKNVQAVVEAMVALDLIRPVARVRPIAVLKG